MNEIENRISKAKTKRDSQRVNERNQESDKENILGTRKFKRKIMKKSFRTSEKIELAAHRTSNRK